MFELVSNDCGRSNDKIVANGTRDWFPSAVWPYRKLKNDRVMKRNDMVVEYDGSVYFVGDVAREECISGAQMMLTSKAHNDTRILTLTALHRVLSTNASVFLMTMAPIDQRDEPEKLRIKRLLLGDHSITVNGEQKHFSIVRVEIAAECGTAAWAMRRPGTYLVVDPGSRTVNFATMRSGKWIDGLSGTLDYGIETVEGISKSQFVRMVIADLSRKLRTLPTIILIGGMAEILSDYFREYAAEVEIHSDPFFANAQAGYELGVIALEKAKAAACI